MVTFSARQGEGLITTYEHYFDDFHILLVSNPTTNCNCSVTVTFDFVNCSFERYVACAENKWSFELGPNQTELKKMFAVDSSQNYSWNFRIQSSFTDIQNEDEEDLDISSILSEDSYLKNQI